MIRKKQLGAFLGPVSGKHELTNDLRNRRGVPTAAIKGVAIICLFLVSALQAWSTKAGTRAQILTTAFKVMAIVVVFVAGLVYLGLGKVASSFSFEGSTHNATGYALALFSALWVSKFCASLASFRLTCCRMLSGLRWIRSSKLCRSRLPTWCTTKNDQHFPRNDCCPFLAR